MKIRDTLWSGDSPPNAIPAGSTQGGSSGSSGGGKNTFASMGLDSFGDASFGNGEGVANTLNNGGVPSGGPVLLNIGNPLSAAQLAALKAQRIAKQQNDDATVDDSETDTPVTAIGNSTPVPALATVTSTAPGWPVLLFALVGLYILWKVTA